MNLRNLYKLVQDSQPTDWHRVESGPTYRERWHVWTSFDGGEATPGHSVDTHSQHAVYAEDVNLTLTWGMDRSWDPMGQRADDDAHFDWAENNPDPSVSVFFADLFWAGSLVGREFLVHVDGGRGVVPLGRTRKRSGASITARNPADFYESCTQWEHDFAALIDSLEGGQDFARYFRATGYVIQED